MQEEICSFGECCWG